MRRFRKFANLLRRQSWRTAVLRHGVAASVEHLKLLEGRAFDTVIDVGANRGQFSLLAAELWPSARIIACEPLSGPAERYERMLGSRPQITLFRTAIGSTRDQVPMTVSAKDDSSSLLQIAPVQEKVFPGTRVAGQELVDVVPLDLLGIHQQLRGRTLLKVDVQGFELEVFKGASSLLDMVDMVLVEVSFLSFYEGQALAGEIIDLLSGRFELCALGLPTIHDGRVAQVDVLMHRKGRP